MARYISKRGQLYRNILMALVAFTAGIGIFVIFFMVPKSTVSFNTNVEDKAMQAVLVTTGEPIGQELYETIINFLGKEDKRGHVLDGWYLDNMPLSPDIVVYTDIILTARWTPKEYKIEIDLDGGQYSGPGGLSQFENVVKFNESYTLPNKAGFHKGNLEEDGLILSHWELQSKIITENKNFDFGTQMQISALSDRDFWELPEGYETNNELLYGTIKLKAVWIEQDVTINFYENVLTNPDTYLTRVFERGTVIPTNLIPNFTSETHDLVGWYLDSAFTQQIDLSTYEFKQNENVYAKWDVKRFTFTFNPRGGTFNLGPEVVLEPNGNLVFTVEYGQSILRPDDPSRVEYFFDGWYLESKTTGETDEKGNEKFEYSNPYNFDTPITENVTIYAGWIAEFTSGVHAAHINTVADSQGTGLRVVSITATEAQKNSPGFIRFIIPETLVDGGVSKPVTEIGINAINNLPITTEVLIPKHVKVIYPNSFTNMPSLQKVTVWSTNENFKTMDGVLYSKDGTRLIYYPQGKLETSYVVGGEGRNVTTIGTGAFTGARFLEEVTLDVNTIETQALSGVPNLHTVYISPKVQNIGSAVFLDSLNLTNIVVDPANTNFRADNRALYTYDYTTLIYYKQSNTISTYVIDSRVRTIGANAFQNVKSLTNIDLNNVEVIKTGAFRGMENLTGVEGFAGVITVEDSIFADCFALQTISLPSSIQNFPNSNIFQGALALSTIIVQESSAADNYITMLQLSGYLVGVTIIRT